MPRLRYFQNDLKKGQLSAPFDDYYCAWPWQELTPVVAQSVGLFLLWQQAPIERIASPPLIFNMSLACNFEIVSLLRDSFFVIFFIVNCLIPKNNFHHDVAISMTYYKYISA